MKKSEKREKMLRLVNKFFENPEESVDNMYALQEILEDSKFPEATMKLYYDCISSWENQMGKYFTSDGGSVARYEAYRALMEMVAFLDLAYEEAE